MAGRHQVPGEPHLSVVAALIRARTVLADGDATGARSLVLRLRDLSAPDDPQLDWVLTMLDGEIALRTGDTGRGQGHRWTSGARRAAAGTGPTAS